MLVSFPFSHYVYVAYGSIIGMRTADRTHQIVYGASSTYYRLIQNKNKVILIKPIKEDTNNYKADKSQPLFKYRFDRFSYFHAGL